MQINRWLHLSSRPWRISLNFSSLQHGQKKNRLEKYPFTATNKWIVLAASQYVIFFCFEFSDIPKKVSRKKRNCQFQSVLSYQQTEKERNEIKKLPQNQNKNEYRYINICMFLQKETSYCRDSLVLGPWTHKHYIFGYQFYMKNVRKLWLHEFIHFHARKRMIS